LNYFNLNCDFKTNKQYSRIRLFICITETI